MKISRHDRLQALRHSMKYRQDYINYVKERDAAGEQDTIVGRSWKMHRHLSNAGDRLCRKWDIPFPVNPFDKGNNAVWQEWAYAPITPLINPDKWETREAYGFEGDPEGEQIIKVNGKLVLMVDLSHPTDHIKAAFNECIDGWGRKSDRRARPTKAVDIWKIMEIASLIKQSEGDLKMARLAKEYLITQTEKDLRVIVTETDRKNVENGYAKALKIIKEIEDATL